MATNKTQMTNKQYQNSSFLLMIKKIQNKTMKIYYFLFLMYLFNYSINIY